MAITAIARNIVGNPNFVTIVTTDDLTTITTTNYLVNEEANIEALNKGAFEWTDTDMVVIAYSPNLIGFFTHNVTDATFDQLDPTDGLSNTLQSAHIFVGNVSNIATGVAMSSDVHIDNTGAATIQANAITTSKIINNAVTGAKMANNTVDYAQLALDVVQTVTVTLSAAQLAAMYATPVLLFTAPGSGKLILIEDMTWDVAFVSAQYTLGGAIAAQYGNTAHGAGPLATSTLAAATLNAVAASSFLSQTAPANLSVTASASLNTAIYLSNATQAFATGDSTVNLYIRYRVITPA